MNKKKSSARASNIPTPEKKATFAEVDRAAKKQAFLDNFKDYGTIYHTGVSIGVPHPTIIGWLNDDANFAEAFKAIRSIPGYMIERAAIERAKDSKNQADTMRIFMLKNLLPESYGEADKIQLEITIKDVLVSGFISIVQQVVPDTCPHCKTNLGLTEKVAQELQSLSERMLKTGGATLGSDTSGT
jgi:hypothetical protein